MQPKSILLLIAGLFALVSLSCNLITSGGNTAGLKFSPDKLPAGRVGQDYEAVITLSGQNTPAFDMGAAEKSLPPGLEGAFDEDRQTYTLKGVPGQAGTYAIAISAACYGTNVSGQTGEKKYELVIAEP